MKLRRRISIRAEASARRIALALFWMQRGYWPVAAWRKAEITL